MTPDGRILKPLPDDVDAQISRFLGAGSFDSAAICLLHSYADASHERQVADIIRKVAPDLPVTCSCDVSREFREYERGSTTALAAYVQPVIEGYLKRFSAALDQRGFLGRFSVMQSNGGRLPADAMARNAISALFSGPAAGVIGAIGTAKQSGYDNLITLDMGGTSTDVALVTDHAPTVSPQTEIDGLPVRTPVIDIVTVGAGGGSIAWIDDGGLLRVGPRSAGANPGPASYRRGGTLATVTDAHLVRGTLRPESFLDGQMSVDRDAARIALSPLARKLDLETAHLADSVIRIAEANIVRAIQQVSTERGHDPRDFVLVPFGGAGPLHAARVAEELGISTVVVPANAGVLSALGLVMSDYVHYCALTRRTRLEQGTLTAVHEALQTLSSQGRDYMRAVGITGPLIFEQVLEMRYVGQAFEVSVDLDGTAEDLSVESIERAFAEAHHRVFEFSKPPGNPIEIVSFRVGTRAKSADMPSVTSSEIVSCPENEKIVLVEGGVQQSCWLMRRNNVTHEPVTGPVLIEDGTSTIYVPPDWTVHQDDGNSLVLRKRD